MTVRTWSVPIARASLRHQVVDVDSGATVATLRVGAGVLDWDNVLQVGWAFSGGYLGGELGYRWRSGGFQGGVDFTAEGGVRLVEPLMLIVRLPNFWSVGPTSAMLDESPSGIGNGTRYLGFALELDWRHTESFSTGFIVEGAYKYERQGGGPVLSAYGAWSW